MTSVILQTEETPLWLSDWLYAKSNHATAMTWHIPVDKLTLPRSTSGQWPDANERTNPETRRITILPGGTNKIKQQQKQKRRKERNIQHKGRSHFVRRPTTSYTTTYDVVRSRSNQTRAYVSAAFTLRATSYNDAVRCETQQSRHALVQ